MHHDVQHTDAVLQMMPAEEEARSPSGSTGSKSAPQMPTPFSNTGRGSEPQAARSCASSHPSQRSCMS